MVSLNSCFVVSNSNEAAWLMIASEIRHLVFVILAPASQELAIWIRYLSSKLLWDYLLIYW